MMKLSPEQRVAISFQAKCELVRRYAEKKDILSWGKVLFPDKLNLPYTKMHEYFVAIRDLPFTSTEAPRGHAKTVIRCFLVPLFQALVEPDTFKHYLNVQSTASKAVAVNQSIRFALERNEILRAVYGAQENDCEKWTEKRFVLKNGVIFSAIGAGESMRGINYNNIRPDYIIVDDLYDDEDIYNVENVRRKNDWFWSALYPSRAKTGKVSFHLQGTAINKEDLLAQLSQSSRWVSKTFKAITDFEKKEVLWPELNSFEDLMKERADMGFARFAREMQNERRSDEASIIKEQWLRYYDGGSGWMPPDNEVITAVRICCDPSIGKTAKSDYTGIAIIYKTKIKDGTGVRYYIHEIHNEHLSLDARVRLLENLHIKYNSTEVIIEGVAGFKDFVAEVRRRTNLPVKEVSAVKDKISNLESKSSDFENGRVFINKNIPAPLRAELVEQLTNNKPNHDDIRDAVLLGIDTFSSSYLGMVKSSVTI